MDGYVYVLETSNDYDGYNLVFDSETSALNAAMDEVVNCIRDQMQYCDESIKDLLGLAFAKVISHIENGQFLAALSEYNNVPDLIQNYHDHTYISIDSVRIRTQAARKVLLRSEEVASIVEPLVRKEFKCPQCSKKNDVDVSICWNCGISI